MSILKRLPSLVAVVVLGLGGVTARADFTPPVYLSELGTSVYRPDITEGPDGTLHAVWQSYRSDAGPSSSILYSASVDGGATWSAPVALNTVNEQWSNLEGAKVVVDVSGVIHVAYDFLQAYYGYGYMLYSRSADGGKTWSTTHLQTGCFPWDGNPAVDGNGGVYLAWSRWKCNISSYPDTVFFSGSQDGGVTMSPTQAVASGQVLSNRQQSGDVRSLLVDRAGTLHLLFASAWASTATGYLTSVDRGQTWQASTTLPAGFAPRGIYESGSALLMSGSQDGNSAMIRSVDGGATWEGPFTVAAGAQPYYFSQIVTDGGSRYFTRLDQTLLSSGDGGATWGFPEATGAAYKLVYTRRGDLLAIGVFDGRAAVIRHYDTPRIAVDPVQLSFGPVQLPGTATLRVTLSNAGPKELTVTSIAFSGTDAAAFQQTSTCGVVAPGASCIVGVTFSPATIGAKSASLDIASDDPHAPTVSVALGGEGIDLVPPTVSLSATPSILWPPRHKLVPVTVNGSASDAGSGLASVVITVTDEYGVYQMTVPRFGSTVELESWRNGNDLDGRHYTLTAVATDVAGNVASASTVVVVPYQQ